MSYDDNIRGSQKDWGIKLSRYICIPQRVILSIMGFFAIINGYAMRICLSVAITRMVPLRNYTKDSSTAVCEPWGSQTSQTQTDYGDREIFDWSQSMQGLILGSFYLGYIAGHVPAGLLSEKFGGKWVLGLGIFFAAVFTLLTPVLTRWGDAYAMLVLRILIGLAQGSMYPSLSSLLAQWVPLKERGILGAFVLGGGQMGTIVANSSTGLLLSTHPWTFVFYVFGITGLLWCAFFSIMCFNDPGSHPYIKLSEKQYLFDEMGHINRRRNLPMFPWGHVFRNVPFYGLMAAQVGHDWTFYVMVSDLPKYMNDVMQFQIHTNGLFSSLPFAFMWIMTLLAGAAADLLIRKQIMNISMTRKFMTFMCSVFPAIFLVLASYAGCNHMVVVGLFTVGMGFMGGYYAGIKLTPLDMSPNYAGTIMALVNGTGAITGFVAPWTVGIMTPNTTLEEWRNVFWVAFLMRVLCPVPFYIWGTGEVQEWNDFDALKAKLEQKK